MPDKLEITIELITPKETTKILEETITHFLNIVNWIGIVDKRAKEAKLDSFANLPLFGLCRVQNALNPCETKDDNDCQSQINEVFKCPTKYLPRFPELQKHFENTRDLCYLNQIHCNDLAESTTTTTQQTINNFDVLIKTLASLSKDLSQTLDSYKLSPMELSLLFSFDLYNGEKIHQTAKNLQILREAFTRFHCQRDFLANFDKRFEKFSPKTEQR